MVTFNGISVIQSGGKNIRITVMNNLLPSTIKYHEKYDLKVRSSDVLCRMLVS